MTRRVSYLIRSIGLMVLASGFALAVPIPGLDLDKLTDESDLVVVGEFAQIQEGTSVDISNGTSEISARSTVGMLQVDQLLKGDSAANSLTVRYFLPEEYIGWRSVGLHARSVFFLIAKNDGTFAFTSPYYPNVSTVGETKFEGSTPVDRVVAAVDSIITSPNSAANDKLTAIFFLSHSKSKASTQALRALLTNTDTSLRLSAAAALLNRNETDALDEAVPALLHDFKTLPGNISQGLCAAIALGIKNPTAIPYLNELLSSPEIDVRRAAASALMHTSSEEAVAPLKKALGDPDFEVRYYGVVGLAEISRQSDWRPSMEDYRADEAKYLRHWSEWGKSNN
jgi:hypothetical protein